MQFNSFFTVGLVALAAGIFSNTHSTFAATRGDDPAPRTAVYREAQAPCRIGDTPDTKGLKTCDEYFKGSAKTGPGVIDQLRDISRQSINNITTASNAGVIPCALVPNPFVTQGGAKGAPIVVEEKTNRYGQSCGEPMSIEIIPGKPMVITFHKEYPKGSLEDGWFEGARLQAIAYFQNQVEGEILKRRLLITPETSGINSCQAVANEYGQLFDARKKLIAIASKEPKNKTLLAEMFDCTKLQDAVKAGSDFSLGQHATDMCGNRQALEGAFLNLASCLVKTRADDSHVQKVSSKAALTASYEWLRNTMKKTCNYCINESCANSCYREKIGAKVADHLKQLWPISPTQTAVASSINDLGIDGLQFAGLSGLGLAIVRRRRKKVVKARRAKLASPRKRKLALHLRILRFIGLSAGIALIGLNVTGCNKGDIEGAQTQMTEAAAKCPWGMAQTQLTLKCCKDGELDTSVCSSPNSLSDKEIQVALDNGAENIESGYGTLGGAAELLGVPPEALGIDGDGSGGYGTLANTSPALAGGEFGSSTLRNNGGNNGGANGGGSGRDGAGGVNGGAQSTITSSDTRTGGSSVAGTTGLGTPGGGGLFPSNGSSLTNGAPGGGPGGANGAGGALGAGGPTAAPGGTGAQGTAYAAGGGGGSAVPMGGAGAPGVDSGLGTGLFGGGGGADRAPASAGDQWAAPTEISPMGGSDPTDYFTRVGMDDSLFKIITRRYREKQTGWALNRKSDLPAATKN